MSVHWLSGRRISGREAVGLAVLVCIGLAFSCHRNDVEGDEIREAAGKGDLARVKALLQRNPELVSRKGKGGFTPLRDAGWAATKTWRNCCWPTRRM
jgi:hypothetical protein